MPSKDFARFQNAVENNKSGDLVRQAWATLVGNRGAESPCEVIDGVTRLCEGDFLRGLVLDLWEELEKSPSFDNDLKALVADTLAMQYKAFKDLLALDVQPLGMEATDRWNRKITELLEDKNRALLFSMCKLLAVTYGDWLAMEGAQVLAAQAEELRKAEDTEPSNLIQVTVPSGEFATLFAFIYSQHDHWSTAGQTDNVLDSVCEKLADAPRGVSAKAVRHLLLHWGAVDADGVVMAFLRERLGFAFLEAPDQVPVPILLSECGLDSWIALGGSKSAGKTSFLFAAEKTLGDDAVSFDTSRGANGGEGFEEKRKIWLRGVPAEALNDFATGDNNTVVTVKKEYLHIRLIDPKGEEARLQLATPAAIRQGGNRHYGILFRSRPPSALVLVLNIGNPQNYRNDRDYETALADEIDELGAIVDCAAESGVNREIPVYIIFNKYDELTKGRFVPALEGEGFEFGGIPFPSTRFADRMSSCDALLDFLGRIRGMYEVPCRYSFFAKYSLKASALLDKLFKSDFSNVNLTFARCRYDRKPFFGVKAVWDDQIQMVDESTRESRQEYLTKAFGTNVRDAWGGLKRLAMAAEADVFSDMPCRQPDEWSTECGKAPEAGFWKKRAPGGQVTEEDYRKFFGEESGYSKACARVDAHQKSLREARAKLEILGKEGLELLGIPPQLTIKNGEVEGRFPDGMDPDMARRWTERRAEGVRTRDQEEGTPVGPDLQALQDNMRKAICDQLGNTDGAVLDEECLRAEVESFVKRKLPLLLRIEEHGFWVDKENREASTTRCVVRDRELSKPAKDLLGRGTVWKRLRALGQEESRRRFCRLLMNYAPPFSGATTYRRWEADTVRHQLLEEWGQRIQEHESALLEKVLLWQRDLDEIAAEELREKDISARALAVSLIAAWNAIDGATFGGFKLSADDLNEILEQMDEVAQKADTTTDLHEKFRRSWLNRKLHGDKEPTALDECRKAAQAFGLSVTDSDGSAAREQGAFSDLVMKAQAARFIRSQLTPKVKQIGGNVKVQDLFHGIEPEEFAPSVDHDLSGWIHEQKEMLLHLNMGYLEKKAWLPSKQGRALRSRLDDLGHGPEQRPGQVAASLVGIAPDEVMQDLVELVAETVNSFFPQREVSGG